MRFYDLPQEYQDLEKHFPEDAFSFDANGKRLHDDNPQLSARFSWKRTPQTMWFWAAVDAAKTVDELPPIPTAQEPEPIVSEGFFKPGELIEVSSDGENWGSAYYSGEDSHGFCVYTHDGRYLYVSHARKFKTSPLPKPVITPGTEVYVTDFGSERYERETYYFIGYARVGDPICEGKDGHLTSWETVTPARQVDIDTIHTLAAKHGFKVALYNNFEPLNPDEVNK